MNEPSVLDYVKAKLKFWEHSDLHFPAEAMESHLPDAVENAAQFEQDAQPAGQDVVKEIAGFPWLVMLPAGAALFAQALLEPPARYTFAAVIAYLVCTVLVVLASWRGVLRLADREDIEVERDSWLVRWGETLVALPLALLAFLLFKDNRFTFINVFLWLASIGLFLAAFLQREKLPAIGNGFARIWHSLRQPGWAWEIRVSRWALLMLAVLLLVSFFRFYRLDEIPVEMVSDHAEKLLDVNDVLNGVPYIFFERNTGREPFQFYWTALVIRLFGLDVSFYALKFGTVLTGLVALYYAYHLGKLLGNRWVGLFALVMVGVAYWPNVISRIALRFPLYPFFVAPLLFYLIRGLRRSARNDFIWAGLWLGIGLNGYTSSRIVPLLVVAAVFLYLLHNRLRERIEQAVMGFMLAAFFSLLVCLPLFRYFSEHPEAVLFRSMTRLGSLEQPLPGSPVEIFLSNFWAAITMFFYNNGSIWPHSIPFRPALDVIMAALFFIGVVLMVVRYIQKRCWEDLLLLVSIPVLLLPSALSLAFPGENPSLNRTAGAYVPVLIIAALGLDALARGLREALPGRTGRTASALLVMGLMVWTVLNNYNLFFIQYANNYRQSAWNTREIGEVVRDFAGLTGTYDTYYVIGYPHWIDSRQVAIFAGHIERDAALLPEAIPDTAAETRMKMFILKPEDLGNLDTLRQLYPRGRANLHRSDQAGKDFMIFLVPAAGDVLP